MERSEATPDIAVLAPDLATVVATTGPVATVWLTTEPDVENAAHRSKLRWRNLRDELEDAGAPRQVLDQIDPIVPDAHERGRGLVTVSHAEGLVHAEFGPQEPPRDLATWGMLPSIVPVLEWRQSFPAHVVVLTDRRGADLVALQYGAPEERATAEGVEDERVERNAPGGWSQRRYQQRAEDAWEESADRTAEEVVRLADRVAARLVIVAGDVRAVQLLKEELPDRYAEKVETVEGGRSEDGSEEALWRQVAERLRDRVSRDTQALLNTFAQELGQNDRAVEGPGPTLEALGRAQVDVLLLHDDPDDERTAWFGPDPTQVALDPDALASTGVTEPRQARLVDVAVRAALGTGAGVRVLPSRSGPPEGLGAVLRWSA